MRAASVDALVVSAHENVRYFTGYHCPLEPLMRQWMVKPGGGESLANSALAIFAESASALIVGPGFAFDAELTGVDELWMAGSLSLDDSDAPGRAGAGDRRWREGSAAVAVVTFLDERGLGGGRIGIDASSFAAGTLCEIGQRLPSAQLLDCRNLVRLVRAVKSPGEIELLRRAAELNERAGQAAARSLRRGDGPADLLQRFRLLVAGEDGAADHVTPTIAGRSFTTARVPFPTGEVFALDVGCAIDGYHADAQFTVSLARQPERDVLNRYSIVRDCVLQVGLPAAQVGVPASAVHQEMTAYLATKRVRGIATGHGIGLTIRDYPILLPANGTSLKDDCICLDADIDLEAGMVLNIECTAFSPGVAAVGCEITCLVEERRSVLLTDQDRTEIVAVAN
jgi:Xaa-Pro dipeptidase